MLIINDNNTCNICKAYYQHNGYCANGHSKTRNMNINKEDLILKVAERLAHKDDVVLSNMFSHKEIAEIVLTYSEGWKYEGEEMTELIDEIISVKENIIRSLNSTEKDLPF